MADLYQSDDTWPDHDDKDIEQALDAVRSAGWKLKHPFGHWGRVVCPAYGNEYPHCYVRVDHTPKVGPTVRALHRGIKNCDHSKGDDA